MTINDGKPHAVGDRGQRYEVTFFNPATFKRHVLGWSETREGADSMVAGVDAHPVWEQPRITDRFSPPLPHQPPERHLSMKLYKTTFTTGDNDPKGSFRKVSTWQSSAGEASKARTAAKAANKAAAPSTEEVDFNTNKQGLIELLNAQTS